MRIPRVSVIMPVFNCEVYLAQAVSSITNQTYSDWELLICDDASTDNSLAVIKEYAERDSRISIHSNPSNLGELQTRNKLLGLTRGGLITFQDADDYSDPRRLELMVSEFSRNPRLGLLASQVAYVSETGRKLRVSKKPLSYPDVLSTIWEHNVVGGAIMMIRKDALESVGGKYREYFDRLAYFDYDLSWLVAERYEAYALPEVLYYYRQHSASLSKRVETDRILAENIVKHLAQQRRESGQDDLMRNRPDLVDAYFEKLRQPYKADPTLVYREFASGFMYNELFTSAIKSAFKAVLIQPGNFINWRTLQYCLRVSLIKWLSSSA